MLPPPQAYIVRRWTGKELHYGLNGGLGELLYSYLTVRIACSPRNTLMHITYILMHQARTPDTQNT